MRAVDLTGWLLVKDVLSPEQLRIANEGIDMLTLNGSPSCAPKRQPGSAALSPAALRSADTGDSKTLGGEGTSTRLGNQESLMDLEQPYCQPFRAPHLLLLFFAARHLAERSMRRWRAGDMLAHPKTMPHLNTILGEGWRLDHGPGLIAMDKGCEGGMLVRPLPLFSLTCSNR